MGTLICPWFIFFPLGTGFQESEVAFTVPYSLGSLSG